MEKGRWEKEGSGVLGLVGVWGRAVGRNGGLEA